MNFTQVTNTAKGMHHPTTTSQTQPLVVAKGADQRMMAEGGPIRRRRRQVGLMSTKLPAGKYAYCGVHL
jgi:hypothetical protein